MARLSTAVLDSLPDATAVVDSTGRIMSVNHAWRMFAVDNGGHPEMTGVGVDYLAVCRRAARTGCADAARVADGLRAVLEGETVQSELEYPCPSPAAGRWFLLRITRLNGGLPGAVVSHVNITRRKAAEEVVAHQAAHDPLTGLANRRLFAARLDTALSGHEDARRIGVLFFDLDGFKTVNDTYGHEAGDEVLLATAHRLATVVESSDCVARLGGDEFAVLAHRPSSEGLDSLRELVTEVLAEPHLVHGQLVDVPGSVGMTLAAAGEAFAVVMRRADAAMYAVKRARAPRSRSRRWRVHDPVVAATVHAGGVDDASE
jgi:diguanylate cyclase (GGDEF)-like protein